MFVNRSRGWQANAEIAFITDLAAERTYEENSMKDLLNDPFSSGLVV